MPLRLLVLLLILPLGFLSAQDSIAWAIQGKTNHLSSIQELAIMDNGDAVFTGGHDSLISFGDFSFRGPKHQTSSGATRTSIFVGRIAPDKTLRWVKQVAHATSGMYVHDLEIDPKNNIYISASCEGQITFVDGSSFRLSGMGMLIAKLSPDGELIWGRAYSGLGTKVHYYHVLPRPDGQCYILANHGAGKFGPSDIPNGGEGQYSQYLGLLDASGNPLWGKSIGGPGSRLTATDLCYASDGNILICGNYRYMDVPNIIDERTANSTKKINIESKLAAGSPGAKISTVSTSYDLVQAFVGKYSSNNGEALEVHVYGNSHMSNATAICSDPAGNIYLGFSLYGEDLSVGGKVIPFYGRTTMAAAKLDRNWNTIWHKSFNSAGSDYIDDLSLDGNKLYAACMVDGAALNTDKAIFRASGMWSGAVVRINSKTGFAENAEHWEVGRANCVSMKDGQGYAGGWFHYTMNLAGEQFKVGQDGQFNAILVRLGSTDMPEEEDSSLVPEPDSLNTPLAETQHRIQALREEISISLWDDQEIDGDIISLRFNDEWVLQDYRLTGLPRTLKLKLKPNEVNYFEMWAKDVGSIPPATTAIIISDGVRSHKISLRSSPEVNGRIEIVWEPR